MTMMTKRLLLSAALSVSTISYSNESAHSKNHEVAAGVVPAKAYTWLKNGNQRYLKNHLRNDGQGAGDRQRLAKGQQPHTIVVSCSDSRVPPEILFDQKLGELFVVRVAGESLDSSGIGSIEYAIEHLGARLVVVLGHTSCGAVKAALATLHGESAGSPHLDKLVATLHPNLKSFDRRPASVDVGHESHTNAQAIAKSLVEKSEIIKQNVIRGHLEIKSALYHIDSGVVDFD
jgi:carbonic anhydrase